MTSLTTILGLLPLALGIGEGAELQAPLALTVMGGLTSATFLTLVFIPALYLCVTERFERKIIKEPGLEIQAGVQEAEAKPIPQVMAQPESKILKQEAAEKELPLEPAPELVKEVETVVPAAGEIKTAELNQRQKELLEKLKTIKKITRKDYAALAGISIPTAARDLKELVEKKLLIPKGPFGRGRWYELAEGKNEFT
jgi:HAE1 family hydrophobic/amphiphilic exporter-1